MSINLTAFIGCALTACALVLLLRQYKPELALPVSIAATVAMIGYLIVSVSPVIERLRALSEGAGIDSASLVIIIKVFGICLVVQMAADVCRDCGESSIAGRIELGGKLAVVIVALPLFEQVLTTATALIGS